ncbi:MAG: hydrolase [Marmoricola sp.]|nr:hydrolase [Marmoricola sp.]
MSAEGLRDDALGLLTSWQAPDETQEQLRTAYVDHLLSRPDGVLRSCLPAHLTTGALVLSDDGGHVLLNLHRKAGRWFHFGGHLEPTDLSVRGAARREAVEESGLGGLEPAPEPLHLSSHVVDFCGGHDRVTHLDVRFLARAPRSREPQVSEESLDVRWWPVDALPTQEPDMVEMVAAAVARAAREPALGTS